METDLLAAIATVIKSQRQSKGLSQQELADLCNLDRTYLSGIERTTRNPTISSVERIFRALGISSAEFLKLLSEETHE